MDAIVLSKAEYEQLQTDINFIKEYLKKIAVPSEAFMDNEAFMKLMNVSHRTAQRWRDEGKIGYSQEVKKIYYRHSDITAFLDATHRKTFFKFPSREFELPDEGNDFSITNNRR